MKRQGTASPALKQAVPDELTSRIARRYARPTGTAQYLGISLATLWRWSAERDDFPKPYKIGPRATAWDLSSIDAWLDAQQTK